MVAPYRECHRLIFLHLLDADRLVAFTYGVRGTPANYLPDRRGSVVTVSLGYRDFRRTSSYCSKRCWRSRWGKRGEFRPRKFVPRPVRTDWGEYPHC